MDNKSRLHCISTNYFIKVIMQIFILTMSIVYVANSHASTIILPDSLQTIEEEAFYGDSSIDEVILSEGIQSIEKKAFANSSITSIYLPYSIKSIGADAFADCGSLVCTVFPNSYAENYCKENNISFHIIGSESSEFEYEQTSGINAKITKYLGTSSTIIIPDEIDDLRINAIDNSVFTNNTTISTIVLPKYLEKVERNQFYGCSELSCVILQDKITSIESNAFRNCNKLNKIVFSGEQILERIGYQAFMQCESLKTIDLPDSVVSIGPEAFKNCVSLYAFHYPVSWNTVPSVGGLSAGAIFAGCINLRSIDVTKGTTMIPEYAFANCNYLQEVILPEGLVTIEDGAFENTESLQGLSFPKSIKKIEWYVFRNCKWLENLDDLSQTSLQKVGYHAFEGCTNLKSANLPDTVTVIGPGAFIDCTSLSSFHYPISWSKIENVTDGSRKAGRIFENCKKLRTINVTEGTTSIPEHAFANCNYLREVTLPEGLVTIEDGAFENTESLQGLSFPKSIKKIEWYVFRNCKWLENLDGLSQTALEKVGYHAFEGCTNLKSANLPDTVTVIGPGAFINCTSLSSFHYPISWSKIEDVTDGSGKSGRIFENCKKLSTINVTEGTTAIPSYAFSNCNYLLHVNVANSVKTIGKYAFYNDHSLMDVYLSEFISFIDNNAFLNCENLTIYCEWGTYALDYARNNQIDYFYLSRTGAYSLNGASWPVGKLYQGDEYVFNGYVRSSVNISNVSATIWKQDTNTVKRNYTITPAVTDYGLQSTFSSAMNIGELELGKYHFTLEATSNGIHEILVDTCFEIVPAPLRINIWDLSLPEGYTVSDFCISGILRSNYPFISITFSVVNNKDEQIIGRTVYPNTLTYDLSDIANDFDFSTVARNQGLWFKIDVNTTAGAVEHLVRKAFVVSDNATSFTNEQYAAIIRFVENQDNYSIFNKASLYANTYFVNEVNDEDAFIIALNDYRDIAYSKVTEFFTGKDNYLINLYKGQIISVLKDATGHQYKTGFDKLDFAVELADYILSGGGGAALSITQYSVTEKEWERMKPVFNRFKMTIEACRQVKDSVNMADQLSYNIALLASNNFEQIAILEAVRDSLVNGTNAQDKAFMQAMDEVYELYMGELIAVLDPIIAKVTKQIQDELYKEALKTLLGNNGSTVYSLTKFAIKIYNKLSGYSSMAKTKKQFLACFDNGHKALNAYRSAFDKVAQGDHSSEAINRLYLNFCYARSSWRSMMDFLKKNYFTNPAANFDDEHKKLNNLKFPGIEY